MDQVLDPPRTSGASLPARRASPVHGKRIVFVNPPYERIAAGYEFVKHITNRSPSLGLLHLASEVRLFGWEPSIIESDVAEMDVDAVARRLIESAPRYVGITLFTVGVWGAAAIARHRRSPAPRAHGAATLSRSPRRPPGARAQTRAPTRADGSAARRPRRPPRATCRPAR
jgi:hypothetical protein